MLIRHEHGPIRERNSSDIARKVKTRVRHVAIAGTRHTPETRRWAALKGTPVVVLLGNLDVACERDNETRLVDGAHEVIIRVGDIHSAV